MPKEILSTTTTIPESELETTFARSGGPGGQNVNKRETKAVVRWKIGTSGSFTEEQKDIIRERLANQITGEDEIVVTADEERMQGQNRATAIERLQNLVAEALVPEKERIPTKPSRSARRARVEDKRLQSNKKQGRKSWGSDE